MVGSKVIPILAIGVPSAVSYYSLAIRKAQSLMALEGEVSGEFPNTMTPLFAR